MHGWVILDKPLGVTSTQAMARVRRLVNAQKAGHGGTLDPLASGILPVALGEATKLIPYVMDGRKTYRFTVRWGVATATDDAEGAGIATSAVRPTEAEILAALPRFVGIIEQVPPRFSAIKVAGARAYDLARDGEDFELASRKVEVFGLALETVLYADEASFTVTCGKGTYVRALARDLAGILGTCGHVTALRRLAVGPFAEKRAISLEKLEELGHKGAAKTAVLPLEEALDDIPVLRLAAEQAQRLRAGLPIQITAENASLAHVSLAAALYEDRLVALGKAEGGAFKPVRGFNI